MYWAATWIFGGDDPKPNRPCVVVRAPTTALDIVVVITRTTEEVDGVVHPPDPALDLNEEGCFALRNHRHAEVRLFQPPQVDRVGWLGEPYLSRVLELYREG